MIAKKITINHLISATGGRVFGDSDYNIVGPCGLGNILPNHFTYLANQTQATIQVLECLREVGEFLLIVEAKSNIKIDSPRLSILEVDNSRRTFTKLVKRFFPEPEFLSDQSLVDHSAKIDVDAQIHPSVVIGANSIIGKCTLEQGVRIGAGSQIIDGSYIGEGSVVYGGCLIGTRDFSPLIDSSSPIEMHPQIGGVRIGKRVEVYPHTTVARGTFNDTIIADDVKIDHHCHVSHNTTIGANSIITNGVMICGTVSIGSNCWIGPRSVIREHVTIGDQVLVMIGSVVTRSIGSELTIGGYPARVVPRIIDNLKARE
jgi:UDP-3-O-[3-hydroxymyristoyl] glucosamine N-acyltransferase LpxD